MDAAIGIRITQALFAVLKFWPHWLIAYAAGILTVWIFNSETGFLLDFEKDEPHNNILFSMGHANANSTSNSSANPCRTKDMDQLMSRMFIKGLISFHKKYNCH